MNDNAPEIEEEIPKQAALKMGIYKGQVLIEFSITLSWITLTPESARELSNSLLEFATKAEEFKKTH